MPAGMIGRSEISDDERAASRFMSKAVSLDAQADAHTMLAMISELEEGSAAALAKWGTVLELAQNDRQRAVAHDGFAKNHAAQGDEQKAAEHRETAQTIWAKVNKEEAEAAAQRKKDEKMSPFPEHAPKDDEVDEPKEEIAGEEMTEEEKRARDEKMSPFPEHKPKDPDFDKALGEILTEPAEPQK